MKNKNGDNDIFEKFFRKEEIHTLHLDQSETIDKVASSIPSMLGDIKMPPATEAPEEDINRFWRELRTFFRKGNQSQLEKFVIEDDLISASLSPFIGARHAQQAYPFWLPEHLESANSIEAAPLEVWLKSYMSELSSDDGSVSILAQQVPRLTQLINQKISVASQEVFKATPVIGEALDDLGKLLKVKGEEKKLLEREIVSLKKILPAGGLMVSYHPAAPFQILDLVLEKCRRFNRRRLLDKIAPILNRLREIIEVEKLKRPEATSAERLHESLDFATDFLHFEQLSSLLQQGTELQIPEERLSRLKKLVGVLENAPELLLGRSAAIVVEPRCNNKSYPNWKVLFSEAEVYEGGQAWLRQTEEKFDESASICVQIMAALRIAELELSGQYDAQVHSDYFQHFDWRAFSTEEWSFQTPVVCLATDESIYAELDQFSQILASERPIIYLVLRSNEPVGESSSFRRELSAIAIAHRNTSVLQVSSITPDVLVVAMERELRDRSPFLLYLLTASQDQSLKDMSSLQVSAAVEGRDFPGLDFQYSVDDRWGRRFSITANPHPSKDWPLHQIQVTREDGEKETLELPFTFADFCSMDSTLRQHFRKVPMGYWREELVPLDSYLAGTPENLYKQIPYIWMVDGNRELWRVAVSWQVVAWCRERLDYWHFLQENSGVRSYHVEQATTQLKQELNNQWEDEIKKLKSKHSEELQKAQAEAASKAMEKLANVLLGLDTSSMADTLIGEITAGSYAQDTQIMAEQEPPEPVAEASIEKTVTPPRPQQLEAYIETALCTSCNECTDLNNRIFGYDEKNQAFIKDAAAGPFADLVKAAEACPVKIIHPGSPLNPDEQGLEEWIRRAEPFN
jgi:ferredoxin